MGSGGFFLPPPLWGRVGVGGKHSPPTPTLPHKGGGRRKRAGSRFSGPDGGEQVAQLLLDLFRRGNGLGDFVAQQFLIAAPQSIDGDLDGLLADAQLVGDPGVRFLQALARQRLPSGARRASPCRRPQAPGEPGQRLCEDRQRPAALVDRLRGGVVDRFQLVAAFPTLEIERDWGPAAAALPGLRPFALVGQEMLERGQKEGAKLAALWVGRLEIILLQKLREECLGQNPGRRACWASAGGRRRTADTSRLDTG